MTRLWHVCTIVLVLARGVSAQEVETTSTDPATPAATPIFRTYEDVIVTAPVPADQPRRATDAKFWAVSGLLTTAMLLDTKSTFDVMGRCSQCREANPYVAPFVERGPGVTVTAGLAFDAGVMALAAKMRKSPQARFHRIWWVVPVALTAGHLIAYKHNLGIGHDEPR